MCPSKEANARPEAITMVLNNATSIYDEKEKKKPLKCCRLTEILDSEHEHDRKNCEIHCVCVCAPHKGQKGRILTSTSRKRKITTLSKNLSKIDYTMYYGNAVNSSPMSCLIKLRISFDVGMFLAYA